MLHLFDKSWNIIEQTSTMFEDQSEKYLFWRSIGERVKSQDVHALIWVSEYWNRDIKGFPSKPISKLPITGEGLMVAGLDSSGNFKQGAWSIIRDKDSDNPTLSAEPSYSDESNGVVPHFFAPAAKSMGVNAAQLFKKI